jgi:hypothetical protein
MMWPCGSAGREVELEFDARFWREERWNIEIDLNGITFLAGREVEHRIRRTVVTG